jgi:transposase
VISSLHRKHRAAEFRKFLAKIDSQVPEGLDVHLICDNYQTHKTPAVGNWLQAHPRFPLHFTPTYSSWLNQVERFFAFVTEDLLRRSVQALEADIRNWVKAWNESPEPFIWTDHVHICLMTSSEGQHAGSRSL